MKIPISISLEEDQVAKLDADKRIPILGRSGIIRKLLFEHYEKNSREEAQKHEEKNDK